MYTNTDTTTDTINELDPDTDDTFFPALNMILILIVVIILILNMILY